LLVIDEGVDGVLLLGYTAVGEFSGDTWHRDVADAMAQAEFAYGRRLGEWEPIPDDAANAIEYALGQGRAV
jgi:hypothetical protein